MKGTGSTACFFCFTSPAERMCSACKVATYCAPSCQRSDWRYHKSQCANRATKKPNAVTDQEMAPIKKLLQPPIFLSPTLHTITSWKGCVQVARVLLPQGSAELRWAACALMQRSLELTSTSEEEAVVLRIMHETDIYNLVAADWLAMTPMPPLGTREIPWNKLFDVRLQSKKRGRGVFAREAIPVDTFICFDTPLVTYRSGDAGGCALCNAALGTEKSLTCQCGERFCSPTCNKGGGHPYLCQLKEVAELRDLARRKEEDLEAATSYGFALAAVQLVARLFVMMDAGMGSIEHAWGFVAGRFVSAPLSALRKTPEGLREMLERLAAAFQELKKDEAWCKEYITADHLDRLCGQAMLNSYPVEGVVGSGVDGIFPFASLINHSCEPNAVQMGDENARTIRNCLCLKTLRPINPGEEILVDYTIEGGPHKQRLSLMGIPCTCDRP